MNRKTKWFVVLMATLGLFQLLASGTRWETFQGKQFLFCLVATAICSYIGATGTLFRNYDGQASDKTILGFSLSLPFVLLSMVQLSLAEAVLVGCVATLIQSLRSSSGAVRSGVHRIVVAVAVQATVISVAVFALNSLLPRSTINVADGLVVRILAGACALFAANTLPVAVAVRLEGTERLGSVWRASFWSFPYYLISGAVAWLMHQGPSGLSPQTALLVAPSLWLAYRYYRTQRAELKSQQQHANQMAALHLRAIEGLALAVEAKDTLNTRGHLRRVQVYSLGIGRAMGLQGTDLEALHAGALLHDIGKLAVPEHILTKPGKLSPEEFAKMRVHPLVGAEIVEQVQFPYPVAPIVRAHHEKWDGTGYPMGLKGDAIPLGARILAAVDCLDALTSDREYRKAMPLTEAIEYISALSGRHFDPAVVEALRAHHLELNLQASAYATLEPPQSAQLVSVTTPAPDSGLEHTSGARGSANPSDFLSSIAAARREETLLRDVVGKVGLLDLHEMLPRLHETLSGMVPYDALAFFAKQGNALRVEYATGVNRSALSQMDVAMGEGLTGWVARNRQAVVNGNPAVDPGFWCSADDSLQSALSIPLEGESELLGVLNLYRRAKDSFSRDDFRILNAVTPQLALSLANSIKYREVQRMAKIDPVTGLPNADLFLEAIDGHLVNSRRMGQPLTVLVVELSEYQATLVAQGKSKTDEILAALAKELKHTCRQQDELGRLGPATFGMIFPGMNGQALAAKLERLEQFAQGNRASFGDLTKFALGAAVFPDDADAARLLVMLARRRTQPEGAEWLASVRSLANFIAVSPATKAEADLPPSAIPQDQPMSSEA